MTAGEQQYVVYNVADGVIAHPGWMTRGEAQAFIRLFPSRFTRQGYYLTAHGERINAESVALVIMNADSDTPATGEPLYVAYRRG